MLGLEYDGTGYFGFQWQAGAPTIQREVEAAIFKLTGENLRVLAASRTDTGVHARGQMISFRTGSRLPVGTFVKGLNYYLPGDIAVKAAYRVNEEFDVRRDAVSREYEYRIWNGAARSPFWKRFSCWVPGGLDTGLMNECCQALVGERDFASFTTAEDVKLKNTVRRVERAGVNREADLVTFNIVASSFLRHQVRNTVGALIRVGQRRMSQEEFVAVMEKREPGVVGPRAPAAGLCLMQVNYPGPFGDKRFGDLS